MTALLALFLIGMLVVVLWFSWLFVGPLFSPAGSRTTASGKPRRRRSTRRLVAAAAGVVILAATVWTATRPGVFGVPLVMWPVAAAGALIGVALLAGAALRSRRRSGR